MASTRRAYAGGATSTTTTSAIASSGTTSFTITAYTGWPYGSDPFFVVVEPGTASEEKILVTRTGSTDTTINIASDSERAQDGTSAVSHSSGSIVFPVFTALDADEANAVASVISVDTTNNRVGIGTATPSQELDVDGDIVVSAGNGIMAKRVGTDQHILYKETAASSTYGTPDDLILRNPNGADIVFQTDATTRAVIDSSGNVGINDTSPSYTLDVNGTGNVTGDFTVDTDTLFVDASTNRVGINDATPSYDLDVNGTTSTDVLRIGGYEVNWNVFSPSFSFFTAGNATITGWYNRQGDYVAYRVKMIVGSTTTVSNGFSWVPLYTGDDDQSYIMKCTAVDASTGLEYNGMLATSGGSRYRPVFYTSLNNLSTSSASSPFSWDTGDFIEFWGVDRVA